MVGCGFDHDFYVAGAALAAINLPCEIFAAKAAPTGESVKLMEQQLPKNINTYLLDADCFYPVQESMESPTSI